MGRLIANENNSCSSLPLLASTCLKDSISNCFYHLTAQNEHIIFTLPDRTAITDPPYHPADKDTKKTQVSQALNVISRS